MRRNFAQPILDINDNEIKDQAGNVMTLTIAAINALLATYDDEKQLSGKEKADRMQLALKINKKPKEVDLTAEQLSLVKSLIAKAYGPLIVGRAWELLELEPKAVAVHEASPNP